MKHISVFSFLILIFSLAANSSAQLPNGMTPADAEKAMLAFQRDADVLRLEHLLYWSELIEAYFKATGAYPFQDKIEAPNKPLLVRIATKKQMTYLTPGTETYMPQFDNNQHGTFQEQTVKTFVAELEKGLGHEIAEKYDIQKVPYKKTVGYYYFVTPKGYLLWGPCPTFGVSEISTLLMDGSTPTLNIVSEGMQEQVFKSLTRPELLNHPTFKNWQKRTLNKEKEPYVRGLVEATQHDSKSE